VPTESAAPTSRTFRLPGSAYLIVLFLLFCVVPLAFTESGDYHSKAVVGPQTLLLLIPLAAIFYIARTATIVDAAGIRVRALFGQRTLPWTQVRGLSIEQRSVYAVVADGAVRLPCVRVADLAAVAKASGGHLPEVAEPTPKFALARRPRRGRR
jgi:hypothetical protein